MLKLRVLCDLITTSYLCVYFSGRFSFKRKMRELDSKRHYLDNAIADLEARETEVFDSSAFDAAIANSEHELDELHTEQRML